MTAWNERRRIARAEWLMDRERANSVPCPEPGCRAQVGETCRNVHTGQEIEHLTAHWRRIKASEEEQ